MGIIPSLSRFSYEKLIDLFVDRFILEKGVVKAKEIVLKATDAPRMQDYILTIGFHSELPTSTAIIANLNTIPYFMISKGETLCFGALMVVLNWNGRWNEEGQVLNKDEVSELVREIFEYCYSIKFNKQNSLFGRFVEDLLKIAVKENSDKSMLLMLSQMRQSKEYFENLPKKLTFCLKNVQVNTPELGSDCEYIAVCEDGSVIKFYDSTMDACVEAIDGTEGLYRVILGTKVGEDGVLIPKKNQFWT